MAVLDEMRQGLRPQPAVLNEELARRTTTRLVGRLEAVALLVQAVSILNTTTVDKITSDNGIYLLWALAAAHFVAAIAAFLRRGIFVHGFPWAAVWVGMAFLMPLIMVNLVAPGEYGASPVCAQLCGYPMPMIIIFSFYPWLSLQHHLRPSIELGVVLLLMLQPLLLMWYINHELSQTNWISYRHTVASYPLGWVIGKTVGDMCLNAARLQVEALQKEYDRAYGYLHSRIETGLAVVREHYKAGRHDLVVKTLDDLRREVINERLNLMSAQPQIAVAEILALYRRLLRGALTIKSWPPVTGAVLSNTAGSFLSRALGDLLKNVIEHGGGAADVSLSIESGVLVLEVADKGGGFSADVLEAGSGSLARLRESARRLGGDLMKDDEYVQGARLKLTVPLEADRTR